MKKYATYFMLLLLIMSNKMYSQEALRIVTGKIIDLDTQEQLTDVKITLYNGAQDSIAASAVNSQGFYFFELEKIDNTYRVKAEAKGYTTAEVAVKFISGNPTSRINFGLNRFQKPKTITEKKSMKLDPIYFDSNSSYLNNQNKQDLAKIASILQVNPTMRIEVRAHADTRGDNEYNNWLSDRRARRAAEWLINEGRIDSNRIIVRDFGKALPAHDCPPGQKCPETVHEGNRRCEFIVL